MFIDYIPAFKNNNIKLIGPLHNIIFVKIYFMISQQLGFFIHKYLICLYLMIMNPKRNQWRIHNDKYFLKGHQVKRALTSWVLILCIE